MRLFVALSLPENVRWQLRMLTGGLPGAKWVPPENYHLTLRFLGEIDGRDMDYVDAALAGIRAPTFKLRLAGIGHFATGGRVKAVWAGVEKEPALSHLQDKVESAVVRAGLPPNGQIGIFDAPNPWGPWTTSFYASDWLGLGSRGAFFSLYFPQK